MHDAPSDRAPAPSHPPDVAHDQLNGWKEIAAYVVRSPRTVQRWERERDFPVHRLAGGALEAVFALKAEIDAWKQQADGWEADAPTDDMESPQDTAAQAMDPTDPATPAIARGERLGRHPALAILTLVLAFALLVVVYRAVGPQGPSADAAELAEDPPRQLDWQMKGGSDGATRLPDGTVRDPAAATSRDHRIVFDYEQRAGGRVAHVWMVARLDRPLRSPCLEFAYAPHRNGRVAHFLGFATSEPLIEDAEGGAHPRNGLAMWLGRSATNTNNSTIGLAEFVDGATHWLSNTALPFQLVPGHQYACRLLIEGPSMTATVSDGRTTGQVTDQPSRPLAGVGQVFVADFKEGVSAEAPPGRYRLRFDAVKVTDRMYRITIDVRPGTGPHLTASTRTVSVAMFSTPTLNAAELDQSSIRLDGIGVGRGPSSQGYACRAEDADGGGTLDLVCEFEVSKLALRPGRRQFTIEACTGGAGQSWEHRVAWVRGRVAVVVDP